jgi:hypothetical protein
LNLKEEVNQVILDKYVEMDTPFSSVQSIVADILKDASFGATLMNTDYLYENLVLLANTSCIFIEKVFYF